MKAKIIKVINEKDKSGKPIVIICFKGEDGKSYRTWTGKQFFNFIRWFRVIDLFHSNIKREIWLDGLIIKSGNLIDADSLFSYKIIETLEAVKLI